MTQRLRITVCDDDTGVVLEEFRLTAPPQKEGWGGAMRRIIGGISVEFDVCECDGCGDLMAFSEMVEVADSLGDLACPGCQEIAGMDGG